MENFAFSSPVSDGKNSGRTASLAFRRAASAINAAARARFAAGESPEFIWMAAAVNFGMMDIGGDSKSNRGNLLTRLVSVAANG